MYKIGDKVENFNLDTFIVYSKCPTADDWRYQDVYSTFSSARRKVGSFKRVGRYNSMTERDEKDVMIIDKDGIVVDYQEIRMKKES